MIPIHEGDEVLVWRPAILLSEYYRATVVRVFPNHADVVMVRINWWPFKKLIPRNMIEALWHCPHGKEIKWPAPKSAAVS